MYLSPLFQAPLVARHSALHTTSPACKVPGRLWELGRLNHVAIAVPDIDQATAMYRDVLGADVSEKQVGVLSCPILFM